MRKDPQALRFCLASNTKAEKEIKEGGNKEGVGLGGGVAGGGGAVPPTKQALLISSCHISDF